MPEEAPNEPHNVPQINILRATSECTDGRSTSANIQNQFEFPSHETEMSNIGFCQPHNINFEEPMVLEHAHEDPSLEQRAIHPKSGIIVKEHNTILSPLQKKLRDDQASATVHRLFLTPQNEFNAPSVVKNIIRANNQPTVVHQAPMLAGKISTTLVNQPFRAPVRNNLSSLADATHTESVTSWANVRKTIPEMTSSSALVENDSRPLDDRRFSLRIRGKPTPDAPVETPR